MRDSTGPREPGEVFHLSRTTTFRWLAEDIKGNVSRGSEQFVITTRRLSKRVVLALAVALRRRGERRGGRCSRSAPTTAAAGRSPG